MPNYGTVSFWDTNTTWMAEAATQIDYFVTVPPADSAPSEAGAAIMNAYVDAVGHSPVMPEWAQGYWHSRNRYSSQSMLLDAAKGFHDRGVNVSVIVIDYMHWVHMGDFSFDPKSWPDVPGMMKTLESYGMRVRVLYLTSERVHAPASCCCCRRRRRRCGCRGCCGGSGGGGLLGLDYWC